ncbi:serine hydrolase domain-containing protein [Streptomyces phaeochromogenes]|uniref:serine hydrolase domain-containing protein n=1 Tax=Streptomyces phaeochromogenes TaxID=1923 RepID=UPI0033DE1EAC
MVLQLVGEGRLSLDDTVGHWLPGVVSGNGNDGSAITVRQLLQHTSGLFDYTTDFPEFESTAGYQADRSTTWTPDRLVAIAMRHTPEFAPGDGWSYSNTNCILAGMIIQKATGHTWDQEVTARHPPAGPARHLRPDDVTRGWPDAICAAISPSTRTGHRSTSPRSTPPRPARRALLDGRLLRPAGLAR